MLLLIHTSAIRQSTPLSLLRLWCIDQCSGNGFQRWVFAPPSGFLNSSSASATATLVSAYNVSAMASVENTVPPLQSIVVFVSVGVIAIKPLPSNGCCRVAHFSVNAQQWVYKPHCRHFQQHFKWHGCLFAFTGGSYVLPWAKFSLN